MLASQLGTTWSHVCGEDELDENPTRSVFLKHETPSGLSILLHLYLTRMLNINEKHLDIVLEDLRSSLLHKLTVHQTLMDFWDSLSDRVNFANGYKSSRIHSVYLLLQDGFRNLSTSMNPNFGWDPVESIIKVASEVEAERSFRRHYPAEMYRSGLYPQTATDHRLITMNLSLEICGTKDMMLNYLGTNRTKTRS